MSQRGKKMIAPIVISAIIFLYYIFFFSVVITYVKGIAMIIAGIIPLALAGVMLYVCAERIKEIRSGEEDDLSKY